MARSARDPAQPDLKAIGSRSFATAFRGFEQDEVRAYLNALGMQVGELLDEVERLRDRVAELQAAPPPAAELDPGTVTRLLGEEAARVLDAARDAATDIRAKAEGNVARLVREATAEAESTRRAADEYAAGVRSSADESAAAVRSAAEAEVTALREAAIADREAQQAELEAHAERVKAAAQAEADGLRAAAQADAEQVRAEAASLLDLRTAEADAAGAAMRQQLDEERARAEADADNVRDEANAEAQRMVAEAQRLRERVLQDLARRRRTARQQVEQLRAARERLLAAHEVIRRTLEEANEELLVSLPQARVAAEDAGRRVAAEPEPTVAQLEDEIEQARQAGLLDSGQTPAVVGGSGQGSGEDEAAGSQGSVAGGEPTEGDEAEGDDATGGTPDGEVAGGESVARSDDLDLDLDVEDEGRPLTEEIPVVAPYSPAAARPVAPDAPADEGGPRKRRPSPRELLTARLQAALDANQAASSEAAPTSHAEPRDVPVEDHLAPGGDEAPSSEPETAEPGSTSLHAVPARPVVGGLASGDESSAEPVGPAPDATEPVEPEPAEPEPVVSEPAESESVGAEPDALVSAPEPVVAGSQTAEPAEPEPVVSEPVGSGAVEQEVTSSEAASQEPVARDAASGAGGATQEQAQDVEPEPDERDSAVDQLFARIRASREAADEEGPSAEVPETGSGSAPTVAVAVAVAVDEAGPAPATEVAAGGAGGHAGDAATDDGAEGGEATAGSVGLVSLLEERDAATGPIERDLSRRLKRVLADEQSEVLDLIRRARKVPSFDDTYPAVGEHGPRWAAAAKADLARAASAGVLFQDRDAKAGDVPSVDDLAAALADDLLGLMRPRIERCFADSGGDGDDLTESLRACYREWKTQKVGEATRHWVLAAFSRGMLAAIPDGTPVRWVIDDSGAPCPDAEDNALAGEVAKGDPFPTGHCGPPAHAGCRCLVVPAHR